MKEKIKLEMYRYENVIFGKVLDVSSELIGEGTLAENSSFSIQSVDCPELRETALYVWGDDEDNDERPFYYTYDSVEEAKDVVRDIKELVSRINEEQEVEPKVDMEKVF